MKTARFGVPFSFLLLMFLFMFGVSHNCWPMSPNLLIALEVMDDKRSYSSSEALTPWPLLRLA